MIDLERQQLRQRFYTIWQNLQVKQPIDALSQQIADVILMHPEYHFIFENPDKHLDKDYFPELGEINPFLHMGSHMGLREQLQTNRPEGIQSIHQQLTQKLSDPHQAEHQMIECLMAALWEAQRANAMPDEVAYMNALRGLVE